MESLNENINIIMECPYCEEKIIINKIEDLEIILNQKFFRHGILKNTGKWINPFISNVVCDRYLLSKKIYGCGKFLKIYYNNDNDNNDNTKYILDKANK